MHVFTFSRCHNHPMVAQINYSQTAHPKNQKHPQGHLKLHCRVDFGDAIKLSDSNHAPDLTCYTRLQTTFSFVDVPGRV